MIPGKEGDMRLRTTANRSTLVTVGLLTFSLALGTGPGCRGSGNEDTSACDPVDRLAVASIEPGVGARNVYVGSTVEVRFNGCLRRASRHGAIDLFRGAEPVDGTIDDVNARTLVFTPAEPLVYGANYNVVVHDTVVGLHGEQLEQPFLSTFRTQSSPDEIPPTTTIDPSGGIFNTPVTLTLTCVDDPNGTGCAGTWYTLDGTPPTQESLRYEGPFTLEISATVSFFSADREGNLEAVQQESYVVDMIPPSVVLTSPEAEATGVRRTAAISARFDEALDPDSLAAESLTITGVHRYAWHWDPDTHTLTVVPEDRLRCGMIHTARVSGEVRDLAGNPMGDDHVWSFTTTEDCIAPIVTADVDTGLYDTPFSVTLSCTDDGGSGCARIVYTTDGSFPDIDAGEGTAVAGDLAGPIEVAAGHTVLRFFGEDHAGNRGLLTERRYTVAPSGLTWASSGWRLLFGVGPSPERFFPVLAEGLTTAFAHDPLTGRLYRGANGLLVSDDDGNTWAPLGDVRSAHAVHARGSVIYAVDEALLVSDDGGTTFRERPLEGTVNDVTGDDGRVVVGTTDGLWQSVDEGRTFTRLGEAAGLSNVRAVVLEGDTLLVATASGLFISIDGGNSFVRRGLEDGLPGENVTSVARSDDRVLVGTRAGLALSEDDGVTFATVTLAIGHQTYDDVQHVALEGDLAFATADPWRSSSPLFRSTDGGHSFAPPANQDQLGPVRGGIWFHDGRVHVGAYPSHFVSDDGGETWATPGALQSTQLLTAASGHVYTTTSQDGLVVSNDGGITWRRVTRADGLGHSSASAVAVDGDRVYAVTFTSLSISEDGGRTFTEVKSDGTGGSSGLTNGLSCVVADGMTVWVAGSPALDVSEDGGWTFTRRYTGTGGCNRLIVEEDRIVMATRDGVAVSEDAGETFTVTPLPLTDGWSPEARDLTIDGAGRIWAVGWDGLFVSGPGDTVFEDLGVDKPEMVRAYGGLVQVATWDGLLVSTDGGASFTLREPGPGLSSSLDRVAYVAEP
jgi:photosystem II stability/assembly factor-like uncharacterized protein